MAVEIDIDNMDDIRARLNADKAAVREESRALSVPDTGVPTSTFTVLPVAPSGDAGADFVRAIRADAHELATWLGTRAAAVHTVIQDFRAVDGAVGSEYRQIRGRLAATNVHDDDQLDRLLGKKGGTLGSHEGGYHKDGH